VECRPLAAGLTGSWAARTESLRFLQIPYRIEVLNSDDSHSHYVDVDSAWEQVRIHKNAKWVNAKAIRLTTDRNIGVTWKKLQSGYCGPLVMQVVT